MKRASLLAIVAVLIAGASPLGAQDIGSLWKGPTKPTVKPKPRVDTVKVSKPKIDTAKVAAPKVDSVVTGVSTGDVAQAQSKKAVAPAAPAVDANAVLIASLTKRVDSLRSAQVAAQQATNQKLAGLGNFKLSGDVRVRYESQTAGDGFVARYRERTRARLVLGANVTDDVTGTIGIASGALDDVQSANQTQTGFFARKSIGFDRFYVTWKPKSINGLTVTGGKFPYAWDRTALTFGNDITPEGVAASYGKSAKGALQSATIAGYVLPFLEVSNGGDSYTAGAQVATKWRISKTVGARLSASTTQFRGADAIALAAIAGTIKPASPNTNRYRTDSTGKVLGYASQFAYTDIIGGIDFTKSAKWPVTVQADVVRNSRAQSDEDTGLWADLRIGRLSQVRDFQTTWSFIRVERDAVLGPFIEQDLRAATNVVSHKVAFSYQWRSNATLGLGAWYGKLIDPTATPKLATPGNLAACAVATPTECRDPWLSRVQLDLSYRF